MPQMGQVTNNNVVHVVQQQPTPQTQIIYLNAPPQQQEEKKQETTELETLLGCWYAFRVNFHLPLTHFIVLTSCALAWGTIAAFVCPCCCLFV